MKKQFYIEMPTEKFCGNIIASTIRPATETEIETAKQLHQQGKCPHNIVIDHPGWMYDTRSCAICGQGLGAI